MAVPGNTFDALVRNVWAPELYAEYFLNSWFFDQSYFGSGPALPGDVITQSYETSYESNAGVMDYDDAMVEPGNSTQIPATWNKQSFQESARLFKQKLNYRAGGGLQVTEDEVRNELDRAMRVLKDVAQGTLMTQLLAQIDDAAAYSDASLSRSTYPVLASYNEDTSTALTLTHMEDLVEALMTGDPYGTSISDISELLFMFPRNQMTNLSRLTGGVQYNEAVVALQDGSPIDAGKVFRTKTFEGIQLVSVPGLTTTTMLCVHKPNIRLHETEPFSVEEKSEMAHTLIWKLVAGWNIEAKRPNNHAKLENKTA